MTDIEALMWRLDRFDARFRSVITVVVVLDRSPGLAALRRRVDVLTRALPRFRERVVPPVTGWATPSWQPDADFDLAWHVRQVVAGGEGTVDDVLEMAAPMASTGLDPSRPLWHMELVEGMAGGRAAVIVRLHHTFTDGLGAMKLAMVLFDLEAGATVPDLPPLEEVRTPSVAERLAGDVAHETGRVLGALRWAVPTLTGVARDTVADPEQRLAATVGLVRSVARVLTPSDRPASPVMTGRSTGAAFGALSADLEEVRAVAAAAGATVNDMFISAVIDGLRRYHARHASAPEHLRLGMPVNLRDAGDDSLRNQFFPARMMVPLQIQDPMDRLRAVHDLVLDQRRQPALRAYQPLAAAATRIEGSEALIGKVLTSVDVMASNVVGSADPLYLAGARVLRLIPFGPRGGSGLNLTTVSYDGSLHVGVNMDPAATPDTSTLMECLAEAFSESVIYA